MKLYRLVIHTMNSNTGRHHSQDTPDHPTTIKAATKWPSNRVLGDKLRISSTSDNTNNPSAGNTIHHAQNWISIIQPDNIPAINAMPPVRGIGSACSERSVSYTHLRAHETRHDLVCRLLLEKK